jgi:signal peptidase
MRYLKAAARFTASVARGLIYTALCLSVLAVLAVAMVPRVTGVRIANVLSNSMQPEMSTGDMIVVRPVDASQIKVGDVILFRSPADPQARIAHRVVEIASSSSGLAFVTKGDANKVADRAPVPADRVLGRVQFHLPVLGYVTREMKEPLVFLLALSVPASLIIAGEVWRIVGALKRDESRDVGTEAGRDP